MTPASQSAAAGYSGTPLPRKLGFAPGMVAALLAAPEGYSATLGPLPDGVRITDLDGRDLKAEQIKNGTELFFDVPEDTAAGAANVNQRYLREWLSHQAASNYLNYDSATAKFTPSRRNMRATPV